jgi:hypothetical protein
VDKTPSAHADIGCDGAAGTIPLSENSRRTFLQAAGMLTAGFLLPGLHAQDYRTAAGSGHKVIVVIIGGVRREETFSPEGLQNIPHLASDLMSNSLFYLHCRNEGVTAHFNSISSILTGNWQRLDDWGNQAPTSPTLFELYRKRLRVEAGDTWLIASNKALTSKIGASSMSGFGPPYGANVVFPKQLMIDAVIGAVRNNRSANLADRNKVEEELESTLAGSNYEGLGWNVFQAADRLDPRVRGTIESAIADFAHNGGPTTGDELTLLITREIMRNFAPSLLVTVFSDVEVAHFGSYAMHLSGIRTVDRLVYELWQEVQVNPDYRDKTTLIALPEFGRDPDGSSTNGFFNHRAENDSTRDCWMLALGPGVDRRGTVERPIRQIDLCPTLAGLLGCRPFDLQGARLTEFRG